jgi:hypothetical protein
MIVTVTARLAAGMVHRKGNFVTSMATVRTFEILGPSGRTREEIHSANEIAVTTEYRIPTSPRQESPIRNSLKKQRSEAMFLVAVGTRLRIA